jgi:hypothetical protein
LAARAWTLSYDCGGTQSTAWSRVDGPTATATTHAYWPRGSTVRRASPEADRETQPDWDLGISVIVESRSECSSYSASCGGFIDSRRYGASNLAKPLVTIPRAYAPPWRPPALYEEGPDVNWSGCDSPLPGKMPGSRATGGARSPEGTRRALDAGGGDLPDGPIIVVGPQLRLRPVVAALPFMGLEVCSSLYCVLDGRIMSMGGSLR